MSAQGDSYLDAATEAVRAGIDNERDVGGWRSHVRDDVACSMGFDDDALARVRGFGGGLR